MSQPICPYCHEELADGDENELSTSYYCCVCKIMVSVHHNIMIQATPCEEEEESDE